ncbi:MAG: hypothetical protein DRH03_00015 [Deltaproteobacteria bacterium]|nr:MAG: hypothetical protein DRH03_00015 [Deltaproteobacteria bacterium]
MKRIIKITLLLTGMMIYVVAFSPGVSTGLTLDEAVALALKNNPNLQKQQLNQALSEEELSGEKAQRFGRFDVIADYGHYNNPRTLIPLTPMAILGDPEAVPTTEDFFNTGIMYEVALFTGFALQRSVEIAELEKEMAGAAFKLSQEQLIYNVKTLYINILSLKAHKKAQSEYYKALQNLYRDITLRVKVGRNARVDQLKAAADQESVRVKVRRTSGQIKIMKTTLAVLLNTETIGTLEDSHMEMRAPDETRNNKNIYALDRYRSTVLDLEKSTKLIEKSSSSYYPEVFLNGYYGLNFGPNDSSNVNDGDWENEDVWQVVVNLKWTLFDFGRRKSVKQKAAILKQQSLKEQLTVELELKRALEEAVVNIELALDDFHSAETELALTRETESIEQLRYDKGAADINDLLYAKARNQVAISRSIEARYSYQNSRFYLDYLLENGEKK